jgi:hypothetical protein
VTARYSRPTHSDRSHHLRNRCLRITGASSPASLPCSPCGTHFVPRPHGGPGVAGGLSFVFPRSGGCCFPLAGGGVVRWRPGPRARVLAAAVLPRWTRMRRRTTPWPPPASAPWRMPWPRSTRSTARGPSRAWGPSGSPRGSRLSPAALWLWTMSWEAACPEAGLWRSVKLPPDALRSRGAACVRGRLGLWGSVPHWE